MSSEISSIDLWTGILRRLEYCRKPNARPKMETRMPDISRARPLRPPRKVTELKSGRTRSASLARAVLPASRARSPKTLAAAVRETVGVMWVETPQATRLGTRLRRLRVHAGTKRCRGVGRLRAE